MSILYFENKKKFINYYKHDSTKERSPYIIFNHGLMSDMNGKKALYIEQYCKEHDYNFIKFDNLGHGDSSGEFSNENITNWLSGLSFVIEKLTTGKILLIGSSMGAWISMLQAIKTPNKIMGMICIASAPDFTENLIWNKMDKDQQDKLEKEKLMEIKGDDPNCQYSYPISLQLILDGRKNLLLNKDKIDISCPIHLIHGMKDIDVPYDISNVIASKINSNNLVLKLIKDANHSLSEDNNLRIICNSIDEILKNRL